MIIFLSAHRTIPGGIGKIDVIIIHITRAEFLLHVRYRMHLSIYHPIFFAQLLLYNFLFLSQLALKVHQRLHDFRQLLLASKLLTFFFEIRKQHEILQITLPVLIDVVVAARLTGESFNFAIVAVNRVAVRWLEFWVFHYRLHRHRFITEAEHAVLYC